MKKIGFLVLAIVLAIGSLGIGYAAWTDTIFINGTVNTGSVDIDAEYFSGSEYYKYLGTGDGDDTMRHIIRDASGATVLSLPVGFDPTTTPADWYMVANATCAPTCVDDEVRIIFNNALPIEAGEPLSVDLVIHNAGSVPVMVDADITDADPMLEWLWDNGYISWSACRVAFVDEDPETFDFEFGDALFDTFQLDPCQYAKVWIWINLPQDSDLESLPGGYTQADFMSQSWDFTAYIYAIQWNEHTSGWWK